MLGLLVAILGTLGTLYIQIGNVKVDVGSIKATVDGINTRLGTIETDLRATRNDQGQILAKITPPPAPLAPRLQDLIAGGFYVTEDEANLVRAFLKVPPKDPSKPSKLTLWMQVDPNVTQPLPNDLVGKIGKLKGLRFVVDANNAVALVESSQNVVIAIV